MEYWHNAFSASPWVELFRGDPMPNPLTQRLRCWRKSVDLGYVDEKDSQVVGHFLEPFIGTGT
jgi:hypothetical protein